MTINLTIQVPSSLACRLRPFQERLPEVLERGLQAMAVEEGIAYQDEDTIIQTLTSNPTPEQVMSLRPSPEFQTRVSTLLARSKQGELSRQEEAELERYLTLEHLVRLAKAHAVKHLGHNQ